MTPALWTPENIATPAPPGSHLSHFAAQHRERMARLWPTPKQARPVVAVVVEPEPEPTQEQQAAPEAAIPILQAIAMAVCSVTGIKGNEFHSPRRQRPIVTARWIYYHLAKELTTKSYPEIGRRCGGKDHATVLHGVRKIKANLEKHADTIAAVKRLLGVEG